MKGRAGGGSSQKGPVYLSKATSQPCEAGAAGLFGASLPPCALAAVGGGSTARVAPLPRVRGGRAHIPHAPTGAGSSLLSLRPGERITAKLRSFSQFRRDVSHPRRKLSLALGAIQPGCGALVRGYDNTSATSQQQSRRALSTEGVWWWLRWGVPQATALPKASTLTTAAAGPLPSRRRRREMWWRRQLARAGCCCHHIANAAGETLLRWQTRMKHL